MATTRTYQPILPWSPSIQERGMLRIKEAASETFVRGALLILSSGTVTEAGASPSTVKYVAAEAAHNDSTGASFCLVWPIGVDDLWTCTLKEALAQTDIGSNYGMVKDATTGYWYISTADANDQATVVDYPKGPGGTAIGDLISRVIIKFDSANIAGV